MPATAAAAKGFWVATSTFIGLAADFLELLHHGHEGLDVFLRAGIVGGGAEAAHAAVTLDAHHVTLDGELQELVLQVFLARSHHEADVHDGAVLLGGGAGKEAVAVDLGIEGLGLPDVDGVDGAHAADALEPLQGLVHHEDGHDGRGVEHRELVDVGAVVEHRREVAADLAEGVRLDDGHGHAGRTRVLLRTRVDQFIFAHVHGTAEDVGGHVRDEGHRAVDVLADLRTVNGVVGRDVEIVKVRRNLIALRDIGIVLVRGARHGKGVAQALGFLEGLLGPDAGLQVTRLVLQEVHGSHQELQAGAAAQEDDFIALRDTEELLPECTALVHRFVPALGAVGNGKQGDTGALEILQGLDGVVDGHLRQQARPGVENVFFAHNTV